jgi:DNA helicase-2/ATP-dependent DNA helicase PcrA
MAGVFHPRPAQQAILAYSEGYMGVSAVPGSGKTFTLSLLAAQLVERLALAGSGRDREVLVVTFTNSAVANFRARIGAILREEKGLLPGVGYRVRTLHGLAHDIVRERPGLVGLSEEFAIIDDRTANEIKRDAVRTFLRAQSLSPSSAPLSCRTEWKSTPLSWRRLPSASSRSCAGIRPMPGRR